MSTGGPPPPPPTEVPPLVQWPDILAQRPLPLALLRQMIVAAPAVLPYLGGQTGDKTRGVQYRLSESLVRTLADLWRIDSSSSGGGRGGRGDQQRGNKPTNVFVDAQARAAVVELLHTSLVHWNEGRAGGFFAADFFAVGLEGCAPAVLGELFRSCPFLHQTKLCGGETEQDPDVTPDKEQVVLPGGVTVLAPTDHSIANAKTRGPLTNTGSSRTKQTGAPDLERPLLADAELLHELVFSVYRDANPTNRLAIRKHLLQSLFKSFLSMPHRNFAVLPLVQLVEEIFKGICPATTPAASLGGRDGDVRMGAGGSLLSAGTTVGDCAAGSRFLLELSSSVLPLHGPHGWARWDRQEPLIKNFHPVLARILERVLRESARMDEAEHHPLRTTSASSEEPFDFLDDDEHSPPMPCKGNCGFTGNPKRDGYCSECFERKQQAEADHYDPRMPEGHYIQPLPAAVAQLTPRLLAEIVKVLFASWPSGKDANTPKEILLLQQLRSVVTLENVVTPHSFKRSITPVLIPVLSRGFAHLNSQVIESALLFWKSVRFCELFRPVAANYIIILTGYLWREELFWNPTYTESLGLPV